MDTSVKLLIVDNDSSIRYSLCEIFRCMGHAVFTAEDGSVALEEMAAALPDILIADLDMPRMSGYELLSIVRRRFPSVYVIAMSGSQLRGTSPQGISADSFYEKCSGVVALLQTVGNGVSSDRQSTWAYRKSTPVIMEQGESCRFTTTAIFTGCPECLRAFPQPFDASHPGQETKCVHCRAILKSGVNDGVIDPCSTILETVYSGIDIPQGRRIVSPRHFIQ